MCCLCCFCRHFARLSRGQYMMVGSPKQKIRYSESEVVALVDDMYVMDNCPNGMNKWYNLLAKHPVIES